LFAKSEELPEFQTPEWMTTIDLRRSVNHHISEPFRGSTIQVKQFQVMKWRKTPKPRVLEWISTVDSRMRRIFISPFD
jgi:hypothetical protein